MEQTSVNQRLNLLVDLFEKGKKAAFARKAGISPQGAQELLAGRKGDPSFKVLIKILEAYPQIRTDWLLFGKDDMLRTEVGLLPTVKATEDSGDSFLPQDYLLEFEKQRAEDLAEYRKEFTQRIRDRNTLQALVQYLAKRDTSGEVEKIQQLAPLALNLDINRVEKGPIADAYYEVMAAKHIRETLEKWEKERREDVGDSQKQTDQQ